MVEPAANLKTKYRRGISESVISGTGTDIHVGSIGSENMKHEREIKTRIFMTRDEDDESFLWSDDKNNWGKD